MKKIEIAYLCNQEKDCNTSLICGKECNHTLDVEHAKNFAISPRDNQRVSENFFCYDGMRRETE